jgi:hypothetical protein
MARGPENSFIILPHGYSVAGEKAEKQPSRATTLDAASAMALLWYSYFLRQMEREPAGERGEVGC